jgi:hypothetical protein
VDVMHCSRSLNCVLLTYLTEEPVIIKGTLNILSQDLYLIFVTCNSRGILCLSINTNINPEE